jgi:membrane protein implicated in regulation of membrane protease activity
MKNPLIAYSLARLGVFAAVLALFLLLQFPWLWATLFSAMLSFAFSLIFLRKQREASSEMIYNAVHKPKKTKDEEAED